MSHLTSQQISECLAGAGDPAALRHASECAACRAEVETLATSLEWFRASVHYWSEQHMSKTFQTTPVLQLAPPTFFGGRARAAGASSLLIHCAFVALLVALGSAKPVQKLVRDTAVLIAPDLRPYIAPDKAIAKKDRAGGGGGGGDRSPLDASKGKLPKPAPRQFTPPRVDTVENPKLPMTPTIIAPSDIPNIVANNYGDPLGRLGIPSNGTGYSGGIGSGLGTGVGSGRGAGAGLGSGGGAYRIGGGVTAPSVLVKVEPEYSEEARKAKWQGTVVLSLVVDENGAARGIQVAKSLGLGLDQKAIEAVTKWRFKPGLKDGKPVPVIATVEVNFRLL